jgi:large conductance mechanosensitive channel
MHGTDWDLQDFITPLIAAIFQGTSFAELSFYVNGSRFKYGHFINAFIVFVIVLVVLYFGVVMPLQKVRVRQLLDDIIHPIVSPHAAGQ